MNPPRDSKSRALWKQGALHTRPEHVRDPLFQHSEFFDPRDLVLVKYEMLRRARVEGQSVAAAARAFGFSRVAFYQARDAFQQEGLPGLLPRRRGPSRPASSRPPSWSSSTSSAPPTATYMPPSWPA
jgi:hypothetical protein